MTDIIDFTKSGYSNAKTPNETKFNNLNSEKRNRHEALLQKQEKDGINFHPSEGNIKVYLPLEKKIMKALNSQKVAEESPKFIDKVEFVKHPSFKTNIDDERFIKIFNNEGNIIIEDFLIIKYDKNGKIINQQVDIDKVAECILNEFDIRNVLGKEKEKLWIADKKKVWHPTGEGAIKAKCEKLLKKYAKINPVNEIIAKIRRKNSIFREEFEKDNKNFINLNNGVWDIENKKLLPHDIRYNFRHIIPIDKIKNITADFLFMKFLKETLYDEDIFAMQELFGFLLFREYFIKRGFIFLGATDTGKTVALDTIINFIGEKNKSGLSLQKISYGTDFNKFSLKDKHLNAYDDLSSVDLKDGGNFKVATGGGYISAEEKFGDNVEFKTYAKQIFACNKTPPVKDNDDMAYFGRWIVFRFDNQPEKIDPFLKNKLSTDVQKSLILNWAIEGLNRLLKNSKFSYSKNPEEVKNIMELSGDPLIQFGADVLIQSKNKITKDDMYEIYCEWANENDKPLLSKEQLGRNLNKKVKYLVPKKSTVRYWDNVAINPNWLEKNPKFEKKETKQEKIDTLDTFSQLIGNFNDNDNDSMDIINKKSEKVSKVSKISDKDKIKEDCIKILDYFKKRKDEAVNLIKFSDLEKDFPDIERLDEKLEILKLDGSLYLPKPDLWGLV